MASEILKMFMKNIHVYINWTSDKRVNISNFSNLLICIEACRFLFIYRMVWEHSTKCLTNRKS